LPTFDANLSIDRQHGGRITPQHGVEFALVCRRLAALHGPDVAAPHHFNAHAVQRI
jgi:hypothetical protein